MSHPAPAAEDPVERSVRVLVLALRAGGMTVIAVAIVLGILVTPALFALALVGVFDFVIAHLYASGSIGPLAARRKAAESGDAATVAESDPSFNPYARED
jgi:hypothetical protein